eukprot:108403_1
MSDEEETAAIVIDNGSYSLFGGFAGDDAPRAVEESVVGMLKNRNYQLPHNNIMGKKDFFVGEEAYAKKGILSLQYPIERGIVTDWNCLKNYGMHSMFYNHLRVPPEEHDILMTEHPLINKSQRETMTKHMFETWDAPRFYVAISSLLSLYASGRTTGIVLESGYGTTYAVPCYEGYILPHAVQRIEVAGSDVTEYLIKQMKLDATYASIYGSSSNIGSSEREAVSVIKEKLGCVALDYDGELLKAQNIQEYENYELPDGELLTINEQRFECTEILFKPYKCGHDEDGIHELLYKAVKKCDFDIQRDLFNNIVLAGGNTMFDGLSERLKNEMISLIPSYWKATVIAPPERKYSSWIGGSILASLSTFEEMWIKKEEYDECGPTIVHRKCT